jgi:hypothetical protein
MSLDAGSRLGAYEVVSPLGTVCGGVSFSRAIPVDERDTGPQRFLISTNPRTVTFSDTSSSPMAVVLNWASALKK